MKSHLHVLCAAAVLAFLATSAQTDGLPASPCGPAASDPAAVGECAKELVGYRTPKWTPGPPRPPIDPKLPPPDAN
jgi:hypothetical protein